MELRPLTTIDAQAIASWRYPGRYSTYDVEVATSELGFWAVEHEAGLVGYCCFGQEARVPGVAEEEGILDVGYGMRPDLMDRGLGREFVGAQARSAREEFSGNAGWRGEPAAGSVHAMPGERRPRPSPLPQEPGEIREVGWARYLQEHPERAELYRAGGWTRARARHLAAHATCAVPGCGAKATIVDHIRPRAEGGAGLDPANLQSLCQRHHQAKTQAESKRGHKRAAAKRRGGD